MTELAERVAVVERRVEEMDVDLKAHLDEQFRLIGGQFASVDRRLREQGAWIHLLDARVDRFERDVKAAFAVVDERLGNLETRMTRVEARLTRVEGRLTRVEGRLDRVEGRLARVEGRLARVEERLARVEKRLDRIDTKLDLLIARGNGTGRGNGRPRTRRKKPA